MRAETRRLAGDSTGAVATLRESFAREISMASCGRPFCTSARGTPVVARAGGRGAPAGTTAGGRRIRAAAEAGRYDAETGFRYADIPPLPETRAELHAVAEALGADHDGALGGGRWSHPSFWAPCARSATRLDNAIAPGRTR